MCTENLYEKLVTIMSNIAVLHVFVLFTNGLQKIVSTTCIENHSSKTKNDFVRSLKYQVWLNGDKGKGDLLLKAFILLLGGNFIT